MSNIDLEKKLDVTYEYAKDYNNKIVHILEVSKIRKERPVFHCLQDKCNQEMTAIRNRKDGYKPYFKHKGVPCDYDNYLHELGYKYLKQQYNSHILKKIYYSCNNCKNNKEYHLPNNLEIIKEKKIWSAIKNFRKMDIVFKQSDKIIFGIEILNTHKVEKEKENDIRHYDFPIFEIDVLNLYKNKNGIFSLRNWNLNSCECQIRSFVTYTKKKIRRKTRHDLTIRQGITGQELYETIKVILLKRIDRGVDDSKKEIGLSYRRKNYFIRIEEIKELQIITITIGDEDGDDFEKWEVNTFARGPLKLKFNQKTITLYRENSLEKWIKDVIKDLIKKKKLGKINKQQKTDKKQSTSKIDLKYFLS